jgi:acyl-CoA synthetase (AMP-forming)/AMP-acid ligase II
MQLIEDSLRHWAERRPDHTLLIAGKTRLSYRDAWQAAVRVAGRLAELAVVPGDRVIVPFAQNDVSFVIRYLGTHLAGAVAIPIDAKGGELTRTSIATQVEPAFVLTRELADPAIEMHPPAPAASLAAIDPQAPADILFTSGTTGAPKGVVLSHAAIAAAAANINLFIGNDETSREVVTVPLNHSFGLGRLRCTIAAGGTLVLVPGLTFPTLVFRALAEHRASGLSCVPTGVAVLLRSGREKLAACGADLRYMEIGSAPMPAAAKKELMQLLPTTRICMHYGLTEASRSAFLDFRADAAHIETVGRPTPNVTIAIHDEQGRTLAAGNTGRIWIKGASIMREYWRDAEQTRRVFRDGWLDSGDLGAFDADGYLHLVGRQDDVINVGGKKVYPATVEQAAQEHPQVAEAACVGVPDVDGVLGEIPVLFVVTQSAVSAEALREFLALKLDAPAVPRELRFVAALPKTASGKLRRSLLKADYPQA